MSITVPSVTTQRNSLRDALVIEPSRGDFYWSHALSYTPLYQSIITSSIWSEPDQTRLVWITLLAMADASGYVGGSDLGLARMANVPLAACQAALVTFTSPDPHSRTKANDGRRIEVADGGWRVLNYDSFRERATQMSHNASASIRMRILRQKRKGQAVEDVPNVPECSTPFANVPKVPQSRQLHGHVQDQAQQSGERLRSAIRTLVGGHSWINHTLVSTREYAKLYSLADEHGFPALKWCLNRAAEAKTPPGSLGSYVQGIAKRHAKEKPWDAENAPPIDLSTRFQREDD